MSDNQDFLLSRIMEDQQDKMVNLKNMCREKFKDQLYDMILDIKLKMDAKL